MKTPMMTTIKKEWFFNPQATGLNSQSLINIDIESCYAKWKQVEYRVIPKEWARLRPKTTKGQELDTDLLNAVNELDDFLLAYRFLTGHFPPTPDIYDFDEENRTLTLIWNKEDGNSSLTWLRDKNENFYQSLLIEDGQEVNSNQGIEVYLGLKTLAELQDMVIENWLLFFDQPAYNPEWLLADINEN